MYMYVTHTKQPCISATEPFISAKRDIIQQYSRCVRRQISETRKYRSEKMERLVFSRHMLDHVIGSYESALADLADSLDSPK